MLNNFSGLHLEAGCDEAGRGCLAGPVFAASVILPKNFRHTYLNDSKLLNESTRLHLRDVIIKKSLSWSISSFSTDQIEEYNILWASVRCMHKALDGLDKRPEFIIVDGNRFLPYNNIQHECVVKGDSKYASIAAASILAKTFRDDYMNEIHQKYPQYQWNKNKGYPTKIHRLAISEYGPCEHHRMSFKLLP